VDLIDLSNYESHNKHYKYILNIIDVFSRKVWLYPLKKKEAIYTTDALKYCIEKEAKVQPKIIQSDNGGEFLSEFDDYLKENNIYHHKNDSHSPNQNAIVERSNLGVRKIIKSYNLVGNDLIWYNKLGNVEENINTQYHSALKSPPNQIWQQTNTKISARKLPQSIASVNPKLYAQNSILREAKQKIEKEKTKEFEVNDVVRIKMSIIFSNVRKQLKAGNSKQIVVNYTPILFKIVRVIKSKIGLRRDKYVVENLETGFPLKKRDYSNRYLFASDMILADEGNEQENQNLTMDDALKLNKVTISATDLKYE
jgi:hypothetical protein